MSDVVLSTTESVTTVTVVDDIVQVAVTTNPVTVTTQTAGVQGASYNFGDPIYVTVRNATGATLTKGTIVYTSGAQGNHTLVEKANASGDATSARTLGWVSADIANNSDGFVVVEGYLDGIDTDHIAEGSQLYLSGTVAGSFTATKPVAPIHLVYVGVVTKSNPGNGRVLVKVQNGYELEELHDVLITNPVNAQVLTYDSATDLWVNATNPADGVTSITAVSPLTGGTITSTGSIGLDQTALSITKSQVSDFTSGTVTSASTAQQAGTAVYSDTSGTATYATTSGTAVFATNSGTATFATNASTAVTISGSIAQSQVTDLVSALSGKANLAGGNAFTGAQTVTSTGTTTVPLRINAITGQTANQMEFYNPSGVMTARIAADGAYVAGTNSESFISGASFRLQIQPASAATTAATFRGASGQTASMLQFQNNSGGITANFTAPVNNVNRLNLGGTDLSATLGITVHASGGVGQVIRGAASQTADLLQLQNSGGTNQFRVDPAGMTIANSLGVAGSPSGISYAYFTTPAPAAVPVVIRGNATQTADLTQWQLGDGGVRASVSANGKFAIRSQTLADTNASLYVSVINTNEKPIVARGASGQTANLQEWQASDGGVSGAINNVGGFWTTNRIAIGFSAVQTGTKFISQPGVATDVGAIIRGAASQTAVLQQWQNSAGAGLANVSASGQFQGADFRTSNVLGVLREISGGGNLLMSRTTSATSSPGADRVMLYVVTGTNPSTLKLVVRAGAAGAETTILDNIPT